MKPFIIIILSIFLLWTVDSRPSTAAEPLPNIVFIMADDLGPGHLGFNGQKHIQTPNLDALRAESLYFTNAYAGCAVCAPCRSVLMTGVHMGHTSVRGNSGGIPLLDSDVTVAEVLKHAGYATGAFGKWGIGDALTEGAAPNQGFDEFFGYYDQVHAHSYYPPYLWWNDEKYFLPGNDGRDSDGLTGEKRNQYAADEIHTKALAFIQKNRKGPFFAYLPYTIPHTELLVPEDSLEQYAGKWEEPNPYITPTEHYRNQEQPRAAYAAMITRLDTQVGEVVELLERLEIAENTILFFVSDNGPQGSGGPDLEFFDGNGPNRGAKGMMYEGGIRTPMIVRWPGRITPNSSSDHITYFPDIMPTLAEIAGVTGHLPPAIDGLSLLPTFTGNGKQKTHDYLYWELGSGDRMMQGIRMGDWKGVRPNQKKPLEVYNLANDIGETTDLAAAHPEIAKKLEALLTEAHTPPRPQVEPETNNGYKFR